jgi:hypothetical protein
MLSTTGYYKSRVELMMMVFTGVCFVLVIMVFTGVCHVDVAFDELLMDL